ncbi:ATP synthase subunit I [Polaromonas sp.]|uniref:ATP synthase subunit I n=1 Tax=Polaromonas sp. TaxID=1869339 RepID=UPI003C99F161
MTDSAVHPAAKAPTREEVEADREDFKPLTREEAQKLREASPSLSPWWVVAGQLVVGVVVACAAWALTGRQSVAWSAFYGALAVVVPAALFVRGLTSKVSSMNAGAAVFAFFLWEMVKIALTVAMLFAAPRLIENLSWPAMLVGLIVAMKVYLGALWFKPKRPVTHQT